MDKKIPQEDTNKRKLRTIIVCCRFKPQEFEQLKKLYERTHYRNFSSFLRDLILSPKQTIELLKESKPTGIEQARKVKLDILRREMGYIGNNINQIAKRVNSLHFVSRTELREILSELKKITNLITDD